MDNRWFVRNAALQHWLTRAVMAISFVITPGATRAAPTINTLHSFCQEQQCYDGYAPNDLLADSAGNLYGTTNGAGKGVAGVVFKLVPDGTGKYKEYTLYSFCKQSGCAGGGYPYGNLVLDVDGNLYGTTSTYGRHDGGTIFKLTHGTKGWAYKVIHSFCYNNCDDGSSPATGLSYAGQTSGTPWDEFSPLFGTARYSSSSDLNPIVYKLTVDGSLWNYQVIHRFNSGQFPNQVLVDSGGNIFGTAEAGGAYFGGLMYKLAAGTWKTGVLHNFCNSGNCTDGKFPESRLLMDASGNLFGTATDGGNCVYNGNNSPCGVVFERPAGGGYNVLYKFCFKTGCLDGASPNGLTMDSSGHLFGMTSYGGANSNADCETGCGTAFELSNNGGSWSESVLYSFCSLYPCEDGGLPDTSPLLDGTGNLFGTTLKYGANEGGGTVFELLGARGDRSAPLNGPLNGRASP